VTDSATAASHGSLPNPLELSAQPSPRHSQRAKIISEADTHQHISPHDRQLLDYHPKQIDTMNDPGLNNLLKWGIQNSEASRNDASAPKPMSEVDRAALQALITGAAGPSDATLMKESFQVIQNPEAKAEDKHQAFENFEMMIQGIDNANNLESLKLWTPLIQQLDSEDPIIRMWAAWSCSTAVQNNVRSQERVSTFPT
jgi:hypothetical protein